jgi:hypothetical protein
MATVLEECIIEEQCSFVFCEQKDSVQKIFIKKYDEEVETEVRKWLRQQSQDFYAAGLEAVVKRWERRMGREMNVFFQVRISHVLCFISICDLLVILPRIKTRGINNPSFYSTKIMK